MKPTILFLMTLSILACTSTKNALGANDAQFIFRATVERIGAATLPEISDVSNCIVVKVNEVVSAPPGFTDWKGKSITVLVKESGKQKPGLEQVFYTNGWLYGKSLAVLEVASRASQKITNQQILFGVARNQDNKVRVWLKASELVISGKVIKVGKTIQPKTISEHDPLWTEAIIKIDSVEKGKIQSSEFKIFFVSSGDVMWEGSPKFQEGDKGIWLFRHANEDTSLKVSRKEDFYPIERLEYIRSLLK